MLRRVLWLIPTLFLVSVAAFQFFMWTVPLPPIPNTGDLRTPQTLPVFFNKEPANARDLAISLMNTVAEGGSESGSAALELAKLGGAALPHVLPRLDELNPRERALVSAALTPVARRMGIGTRAELTDPESASLFWTRFWQDREFDFRPVVVKRLVQQLARRSLALRRDDVVQLDTYALPELVRTLGRVTSQDDVQRVRRLSMLLAHITEKDWRIPETASVETARKNVQSWQSWWLIHGDKYVSLDGLAKATATVSQTRYGKWLRSVPLGMGTMHDGATVLASLRKSFMPTLMLLVCGALGGYLIGAALAVGSLLRLPHSMLSACVPAALIVSLAPVALYAPLLAPERKSVGLLLGCLLMLAIGASASFLYQRAATKAQRSALWWPSAPAGPSIVLSVLRASAETTLALLCTALPQLLLAAAVMEQAFSLGGLGTRTVRAVQAGEVAWLMAIALLGTLTAAFLQLISDLLAARFEQRTPTSASLATLPRPG